MSKIWVYVDQTKISATVLMELHRILEEPIGVIKSRIETSAALATFALFYNDHDDVTQKLRAIIYNIPAAGANLRFFETPEEQTTCTASDEISGETLENILTTKNQE